VVASVTGSLTSLIGDHGLYAVFALMAIDAVFPAASELVMVYAGALAAPDGRAPLAVRDGSRQQSLARG
jgi:membrane protein DedA with SNARE-associated domain